MSEVMVSENSLTDIADSIRNKLGTQTRYRLENMSDAIDDIETDGGQAEEYFKKMIDRTITNIKIPNGTTSISNCAFIHCNNLDISSLPNSITSIGGAAFEECTNLKLTRLPDSVTSIGRRAFYRCFNLRLTSLPSNLSVINDFTFYCCQKLAITHIPSSVTSIKQDAFYNCSSLTTLTFDGKPNSIGYIFSYCDNLTVINVPWSEGEVSGAPWGAPNATIVYNYTDGGG